MYILNYTFTTTHTKKKSNDVTKKLTLDSIFKSKRQTVIMIVITTTLLDLELTGSNNTSACNHVFLPLLCYFLFFLSLFSFLFFSHLLLSFTLGLILLLFFLPPISSLAYFSLFLLCSFPPFPPVFFSFCPSSPSSFPSSFLHSPLTPFSFSALLFLYFQFPFSYTFYLSSSSSFTLPITTTFSKTLFRRRYFPTSWRNSNWWRFLN